MKKNYITPFCLSVQMVEKECVCTTSEIDVGGKSEHYDVKGIDWNIFEDNAEYEEDECFEAIL